MLDIRKNPVHHPTPTEKWNHEFLVLKICIGDSLTCKTNWPCNVHCINSRRETGAGIVLIAVQGRRVRQRSLQSPKYPETGPGCPGRLLRPSLQRHRPHCVPNGPHKPHCARFNLSLHVKGFSCKDRDQGTQEVTRSFWEASVGVGG